MNKQLGFSLNELLISLFLAGLISTSLIQIYLWNKTYYQKLQEKLKIQFEVQWAQDLLVDSIHRAGFTPCLSIEQILLLDRRANKHIQHYNLTVGDQEIQVNRMSEYFGELLAINTKQELLISSTTAVREGQAILIADCSRGEVHRIKKMRKTSQGFIVSLDSPIYFTYPSLTYVGQWLEEHWLIKKKHNGNEALYYQQVHSEELTPLVHAMKIKTNKVYGTEQLEIAWELEDKTSHHFRAIGRL